ncbi:MAG: hypothetical protein NVSMB52_11650 [Chloroflexota bacterium]
MHHSGHGHRGGLHYEAEVYRRVLQPLSISAPCLYGAYDAPDEKDSWLFLEYLEDSYRVNLAPIPDAMTRAAGWIGRFHAANEMRLATDPMLFLNKYDDAFYAGWARRTSEFTLKLQSSLPWLRTLCQRFEECIDTLLMPSVTVIHGEYTMSNTLVRGDIVYPVDWQSAAIAAGEIDVACLLEGWPADTEQDCVVEYKRERWPAGAPANFARRFDIAKLYWHFRWLGDQSQRTTHESLIWHVQYLKPLGERLGLL